MLNEALLLLRKVVIIFDKKSYFKYYLLIGWGTISVIIFFFNFSAVARLLKFSEEIVDKMLC
jgi:hypothetical protein